MAFAFPRRAASRGPSITRQGLSRSQLRMLKSARTLSGLFDTRFNFLGFRFGIDPIIGLVPFVGDLVSASLSVYLLFVGRQLGLPRRTMLRMASIAGADFMIGLVPFLGDAADAVFKSHARNYRIIEEYVRKAEGVDVIDGVGERR